MLARGKRPTKSSSAGVMTETGSLKTGTPGDSRTACFVAQTGTASGWRKISSAYPTNWTSVPVQPGLEGTLPALLVGASVKTAWVGPTLIWCVRQQAGLQSSSLSSVSFLWSLLAASVPSASVSLERCK